MLASMLLLLGVTGVGAAPPVPDKSALTRAAPGAEASLTVGLRLRDADGLDALIAAQHDPGSPTFRRWLTPTEFGARFGLSQPQYEAVAGELARTGLQVQQTPGRLILVARGSVKQVEALLGVALFDVRTPAGQAFRTFRGEVHLPPTLAAELVSLGGLDTRPRFKRHLDVGPYDSFGPQDLRRFYDAAPLHAQGFAGQLSRVGVIGPIPGPTDMPSPADIAWFYVHAANAPVQFELVNLGLQGSAPDDPGDKEELEMDAELSAVAAPLEQKVTMVLGPPDTFFVQDMSYFANDDYQVTAVSLSYGLCEADELRYYPGEPVTVANLAAQASAEGQAWFVAAGDDGADDCESGPTARGGDGAQADFPGTVPYMVPVGGTSYTGAFDANHAIAGWSGETVWNSGRSDGAGGGGSSQLFAKPSYQQGLGESAAFRDVPDFALLSDPDVSVAVDDTRPGTLDGSGGTSAAAPLAAGIFALVNDYIGGCGLGAPQFELYRLGRAGTPVFHDITSGNLDQNGVSGPSAAPGFDDASGWGSLDIAALARAWPTCAGSGIEPAGPLFPDGGWPLGDAGLYDPGEYDAGVAFRDAGARAPFDPCAALGCGSAACLELPEGPSRCEASASTGSSSGSGSGSSGGASTTGGGSTSSGATSSGSGSGSTGAAPMPKSPDSAEPGCGCASGRTGLTGAWALLLALCGVRRKRAG